MVICLHLQIAMIATVHFYDHGTVHFYDHAVIKVSASIKHYILIHEQKIML